MKANYKKIIFLFVLMMTVVCSTSIVEASSKHLKYDVPVPATSTYYEGAMKFAEIIKIKTEGKYVIDVFPNEQLGGGNIIKGMEMLRGGIIDFDVVNILMYTPFNPKFSVVLMPWLIGSLDAADKHLSGDGGKMLFDLVEEVGMHPMAFGETGFRQITNNVRPIKKPQDLSGLKIRCPTMKMFVDFFKLMGADPTVIHFGELFTALQQGSADGQENPLDTINSARLQEVQKYLTVWNEAYDGYIMSCSQKLWKSLSDEDKKIFSNAAIEAMKYQKQLARKKDAELLENWKGKLDVTILSPEEINVFRNASKPLYEEYEDIIGLDLLKAFGYSK